MALFRHDTIGNAVIWDKFLIALFTIDSIRIASICTRARALNEAVELATLDAKYSAKPSGHAAQELPQHAHPRPCREFVVIQALVMVASAIFTKYPDQDIVFAINGQKHALDRDQLPSATLFDYLRSCTPYTVQYMSDSYI